MQAFQKACISVSNSKHKISKASILLAVSRLATATEVTQLQLRNLRIGQKGLLLISLHLACELAFFLVLTKLLYDANFEQQRQFEAKEVLLRTSQLALTYDRAAHYLSMWSKGRPEYRTKALLAIDKLKGVTTRLEEASAFDPVLKNSFAAHKGMLGTIFKNIDIVSGMLVKNGQIDVERVSGMMQDLGQLTRNFGDWQEEFVSRAEHIESESPKTQEKLRRTQYILISTGVLANLVITLILFRFFSTSISRRLGVLEDNTVRFGLGTKLHPPVGGNDEIRELDVTFHRMVEQIEVSRRRQRALTENTADMIFSVSEKMRVTEVNDACSRLLGVKDDELLGKDVMTLVTPDSNKPLQEKFESARQTSNPLVGEAILKTSSGEQIETAWTISWSEAEHSWFCVARNIAAQKHLERLRQEFLAMITHDMRSPLTSILSNLQMLRKGAYGAIEEKSGAKIDVMIGNCRQLLSFINDLLDVDRLESGIFELEQEPVSVRTLFEKSTSTVDGAAIARKISIEASDNELQVLADEARIVQVLVNLLSNAIKFSDQGSRIQVAAERNEGNTVKISVSDHGRGISAEKIAIIFDRYQQSTSSDAHAGSGFGLGLYICKQLLKAHDSDLIVRSREGEGSTFSFNLKAASTDDA